MDVVFQDNKGVIEELAGAGFSSVKAIVDRRRQNILLLWLNDKTRDCWYRIYVDEFCCGVDRYVSDESLEDEETDDDFLIIEYSKWFWGKELVCAEVMRNGESSDSHMVLSLQFKDGSSVSLDYGERDDKCIIRFIPKP